MKRNINDRYIEKLQCYSCVNVGEEIVFPTLLNQVTTMSFVDGHIKRVVHSNIDNKKSIYSIFYINEAFYFLENDRNIIVDDANTCCVKFKENTNNVSYLFFAKQYGQLLYVLYGDGNLFTDINASDGTYVFVHISGIDIFVSVCEEGFAYYDKHKILRFFSFKTLDSEMLTANNIDLTNVSGFLKKNDNSYYLMNDRLVISSDKEIVKQIEIDNLEEYKHIHLINDKLYLIPNDVRNEVIIISKEKKEYRITNCPYPNDLMEYKSENYQFIRSMETEKCILYPMRGINYFLAIIEGENTVRWIKPIIDKQKIAMMRKGWGEKFKEGIIGLDDFLEVVINE